VKYFILAILLLTGTLLFAQTDGGQYQAANNSTAYFFSGSMNQTEQLKIYTYVWGQVQKTGLYIVPDNTDILALISLAGGPTEDAKLSKVRIIRPTTKGEKIIFVNLKKYIDTGNEALIPVMQPGDTVIVSGSIFYAFYRAVDFISKIAIVLSVVAAINSI